MSPAGPAPAGAFLLPPRPEGRTWLWGGLLAGSLFGLGEILAPRLSGLVLPPRVAFAIAAADALAVATLAVAIDVVLRGLGRRPSHSELAGWMLAPLLALTAIAPLLPELGAEGGGWLAGLTIAVGAGLAVGGGFLASVMGGHLERAGRAVWGPLLWTGVAALIALSEAVRLAPLEPRRAVPGLVVAALVVAIGLALAIRSGASPLGGRAPGGPRFARAVAWTWLAIAAVALAPWLTPWLLSDESAPLPDRRCLVLVVMPPAGPDAPRGSEAAWDLAAGAGVRLEVLDPEGRGERSLLAPGREPPLAVSLAARGWETAALVADPRLGAHAVGAEHVDRRPGPAALLAETSPALAGAALLRRAGAPLLERLDLARPHRTPQELADSARAWLLRWRVSGAPRPFALVFDARVADAMPAPDAVAAAVEQLLAELDTLQVADRSVVVAVRHEPARAGLAAAVRGAALPGRPTTAGDLGRAILEVVTAEGTPDLADVVAPR